MKRMLIVWGVSLVILVPIPMARGQDRARPKAGELTPLRSTESIARTPDSAPPRGVGLAALQRAAAANKYLFLFFWKEKDRSTASLWDVYQSAMVRLSDRADAVAIRVDDAAEKAVVDRFGAAGAPLPLVLAVAPNGAVTKGFPGAFDEASLANAFVSPGTARCLKALQDRKLVLVCIEHLAPGANAVTVPQGVVAFRSDPGYAQVTEIVGINAADRNESSFLQGLGIDPRAARSTTALLVPPGTLIGKFEGTVTKKQLMAQLAVASSGACAGGKCGPNGCGPRK